MIQSPVWDTHSLVWALALMLGDPVKVAVAAVQSRLEDVDADVRHAAAKVLFMFCFTLD